MSDPAESIAELVDGLRDKDGVMRASARWHLVALGTLAAPVLVELLRAPQQHVRWEAAKALEDIASPSAAPARSRPWPTPTAMCLGWPPPRWWRSVRRACSLAARLAGKPAPNQPCPDAMYRGAHHVFHSLSKQTGDQRFDRLLEALGREDPELSVPLAAQELLGKAAERL